VLGEQLLQDGGHIERAPYYHALLLKRLFDCYHYYVKSERHPDPGFTAVLREALERMMGWLDAIAFSDDSLPALNDVPPEVVPDTGDFHDVVEFFGLSVPEVVLSDSGFRKGVAGRFEFVINVGDIAPPYQPGHAHADTLGFLMQSKGLPFIVDPGTGTYDPGPQRAAERSTRMHNTVSVCGQNSSDVWSSFRVGRRARIVGLHEEPKCIEAGHDGYRSRFGIVHRRRWQWSGNRIEITDWLDGNRRNHCGEMRLHFHFRVQVSGTEDQNLYRCDDTLIRIVGAERISLQTFEQPLAFGRYRTAAVLVCTFRQMLTTIIEPELHAD
jgi:uncharacterized heparinase superfamily protein